MIWHLQYTPLIWPLLVSAAFMDLLGIYTWRRSTVPAARSATALLFIATGWSLISAFELASTDLTTTILWDHALVLWTLPFPAAALAFAVQYAGRGNWLTRPRLAALAVVPAVTLLVMVTNDAHGLMWTGVAVENGQIQSSPGIWYWIYLLYSGSLMLVHSVILVELYLRARGLLRWQIATMLFAWLVPLAAYLIDVNLANPVKGFSLVVPACSLTGLAYALAIFRFRMLDVTPLAHDAVMQNLHDGVLVLDTRDRITDINLVAQQLLGLRASQAIGRDAVQTLHAWRNLLDLLGDAPVKQAELRLGEDAAPLYYDVRLLPLTDFRGFRLGRLIVLHDITELKQMQENLLRQQRALAVLGEREHLAWELHDSLAQVIGFINVQAQAVCELLATGRSGEASASMGRLAMVARDAHTDIRGMIASLSTDIAPQQAFLPTLRQQLQQFSQDYRITTELVVPEEPESAAFGPAIEAQLLRIVQEALTNIRKHARAHNVRVSVVPDTTEAQVVIADDGMGFDPEDSAGDCKKFGLRVMRERAVGIGGHLQLCSTPGKGTQVIVQVPWHRKESQDVPHRIAG